MINFDFADKLSEKLSDVLPSGLNSVKEDAKKNFKRILEATFTKMNLVTREEFDAQAAVLTRTRQQIAVLEKQVSELESLLKNK